MDEAAVLAECAAHPDDDGPRLVWADLVGGERGELVVVQCDLARGGLTPAEATIRRTRERELLAQHASEWAGPLTTSALQWSYRRGFIEAARLVACDANALAAHPLLTSVIAHDPAVVRDFAALRTVRALGIDAARAQLAQAATLAESLRCLAIEGLAPGDLAEARTVIANTRIEQLCLPAHHLDNAEVAMLLEAAPHADTFVLESTREVPIGQRIRALRAAFVDLSALARSSRDTLERLHTNFDDDPMALLELGALQILDIAGEADAVLRLLAGAMRLPRLRVVRVPNDADPDTLRAFVAYYGAQLELVERGSIVHELPHHDRGAFLTLGAPHAVRTRSAAIARLDADLAVWDLPSMPTDVRAYIGRSTDCVVQLADTFVARRHCSLAWHAGQHVVEDLGSANGVCVDGDRVMRAALADGAELFVGRAVLRYFCGPGARERALAAVEQAKTHDPVTRLPIDPGASRVVEVTNWDHLRRAATEPRLLRMIADALRAYAAGERLTYVRAGVFGVEAATGAQIGRRTLGFVIDTVTIEVELSERSSR